MTETLPILSIPPAEAEGCRNLASVIRLHDVIDAPVSAPLRIAMSLLRRAYGDGLPVVVRPEMFTHGDLLDWLRAATGHATRHICLSNGRSVRLIPGVTNDVFFYCAGQVDCIGAIRELRHRAPQLLGRIHAQMNTAFDLRPNRRGETRTYALQPAPNVVERPHILPFSFLRNDLSREIQTLSRQAPVDLPSREKLTYVSLCEPALQSPAFMYAATNLLVAAYTDPGQLLILSPPVAEDLESRAAAMFRSLGDHAISIPSGAPDNVFIHVDAGEVPAGLPARSRLIAHESEPFWRRSPAFYAGFADAVLVRERDTALHRSAFLRLLQDMTGRGWTELRLPEFRHRSLARYVF